MSIVQSVKLWSLISLFSLISFGVYSQIEYIQFKSEFEKEVLTNLDHHQDIDFLLAISEESTEALAKEVALEIKGLKQRLSEKKFDKKSEEKQLKLLFSMTHQDFFTKYQEVANFSEIFDTKTYNCVTGTALYSLLLEEYQIPYAIKESPTHVYAIAYPKTKSIVLESTAPGYGYYSPSEKDLERAVESLVELKYVTEEEVQEKGIVKVHNDFFFSKDEINIRQLAGLQYHNEAVTFFDDKKFKKALNANYKSQLLYPSEKTEYLNYILLANIMYKADFKDFEDVEYLAQYANIPLVEDTEILGAFGNIVNDNLFKKSNTVFTDSAYHYLQDHIEDSTLTTKLSEVYYVSFASYYGRKSYFKKCLKYATLAYEINPQNVDVQSLVTHSLVQDLGRRTGSASMIKKMDEYIVQYPFLAENSLYQSLYFHTYAYIAFNHMRLDQITKGVEYLELMEEVVDKFGDDLQFDENQYGVAYSEAGAAYYRKGKYKEAKRIIEKGLERIPDHQELKDRLEIVLEEF